MIDRVTSLATIFACLPLGRTPQRWMVRPTYSAICDSATIVDAKANLPLKLFIVQTKTMTPPQWWVWQGMHKCPRTCLPSHKCCACHSQSCACHETSTQASQSLPPAEDFRHPKAIYLRKHMQPTCNTRATYVQHTCTTRTTQRATRAFFAANS